MEQSAPEEMLAPPPPRRGRSAGAVLRLILVFLCIGLGIVFTLQNTDVVTVEFLAWSVTLSRALLIFLVVVIGALIGWLLRSMAGEDGFQPLG